MINKAVFKSFPILESDRLRFRAFQKEDAVDYLAIRGNEEVMRFMDAPTFTSIDDATKMIETIQSNYDEGGGLNWIIEEKVSGQVIGYFGFWRLDYDNARGEIGYALKPYYWGKGYMREALTTFIGFAFKVLGLNSIEANVNTSNTPSQKLLLALGFRKEAHFRENYYFDGVFLDSLIYCLIKSDIFPEQ